MTKAEFIAQSTFLVEKNTPHTGGVFVVITPHERRKLMYSGLALEHRTKAKIAGDIQDLITESWNDYRRQHANG